MDLYLGFKQERASAESLLIQSIHSTIKQTGFSKDELYYCLIEIEVVLTVEAQSLLRLKNSQL